MTSHLHVIVGLGVSGLSCAHFLKQRGIPIAIIDTRLNPPQLAELQQTYPNVDVALGEFNTALLDQAETIVLSPGISLKEPAIAKQIQQGKSVIGDIELFARAVKHPVIAITGTNAKSTVTTLVGLMAKEAGLDVQVGGNLGTPALTLLDYPTTQLIVLELSSFQLETTFTLKPQVASVLNITPDHMDRYADLNDYQQAKHRIYQQCEVAICNRDDELTNYRGNSGKKFYFTLNAPQKNEFGLLKAGKNIYLAYENNALLSVNELPVKGKHYQANALAALAIGHGFGLPFAPMIKVLREFAGLPHRCQWVRDYHDVHWYNDSKGTNVGATYAAIEGLGSELEGKLILIAGGVGKGADFSPLIPLIETYARHVVLIGEAAAELEATLNNRTPSSRASSMEEAVKIALEVAQPKDSVLLSPACASFDMFRNYEHRGEVFMDIVKKLSS